MLRVTQRIYGLEGDKQWGEGVQVLNTLFK